MWDSISSMRSFKLVSDQQNLQTESFTSKFLKKVKMQAAPFLSSSNHFLQARNPPTLFGFCDLFNVPGTPTITNKESDFKMLTVKMDDVPVTQNFSQLPGKVPRVPPIISGFIGTKSYCPKKESFLDPFVMNLLNCKLNEKLPDKSDSSTCKSIAEEVKKYFNQEKNNVDENKSAIVTKSINSKEEMDKNTFAMNVSMEIKVAAVATKPVCTVLPIFKTKEGLENFDHLTMANAKNLDSGEKTDETLDEISLTMLIQSISTGNESTDNINSPGKTSQLCLNCQANLKPLNSKKLKKFKVPEQNLASCLCVNNSNNALTKNEKKVKSSKSRKARKSQQKRKNKLKQCRERQMIGIVDDSSSLNKKSVDASNAAVHDELDCAFAPDFEKNMERSMPSPIMDDLEFDIVFDYETELCGVHSLSHSSNSRDYDCDNSNISFILNGNDDLYESDSDCSSSEVNGEFDDLSWQSFKTQFAEFQEVDHCSSVRETCFEVNFDNDGFEILISGNVCDPVDFAAQAMAENLSKVNKKWNEDMKDCHPPEQKTNSKVSFAPEDKLVQIRKILLVCEDERKSDWEQFSLDRSRFQKRIANMEPLLSIILSKEHREEVYNARFGDDMQN